MTLQDMGRWLAIGILLGLGFAAADWLLDNVKVLWL